MASNSNQHEEPVIVVAAVPVEIDVSPPPSPTDAMRQTKRRKKKSRKPRQKQQHHHRWWILIVLLVFCGIAALWLAFLEDDNDAVPSLDDVDNENDSWTLPSMPPLIDLPDQRSVEELKQEYKSLKFDIPFTGNKESGDISFQVNRTALLEFLYARDKTRRKLLAAAKREQQGTKAPRQELQGIASESTPLALSFEKG